MGDKKKDKLDKKQVHEDLEGFDIRINPFGEIESNFDIDKLNEFLNDNVDDKKLRERDKEDDVGEEKNK